MSEPFAYTQYGFDWGSAKVERAASMRGVVCLQIKTPKGIIDIQVSKAGHAYIGVWSCGMPNAYKTIASIKSKRLGWRIHDTQNS